jgi:MFS family permease
MAYNLMAPLLPLFARELGATALGVGVVGSAGTLGALLLILPISQLSDRTTRRTALLVGWAFSAAGVLLMWLARSWVALLPGAFLSMAAVAALPTLNALALEELPAVQRTRGFALLYAAAPLGALLGSALAGLLGAGYGLRTTTAVAGISMLAATLALLPITETRAPVFGTHERPQGSAGRATLSGIAFAVVAAGGFLFLAIPGSFIAPYLHDVAHQTLVATGLFAAVLSGAQFAWSLLFSVWPRRSDWVRIGRGPSGMSFPAATLQALVACLAANAVFGLLMPVGGTVTTLLALGLRGSQFTLQALGSALLGDVVAPGPRLTTRLTYFSAILGMGAAGAPLVGGWLYGLTPAYPFWLTGASAAAGAVTLLLSLKLLPHIDAPAVQ